MEVVIMSHAAAGTPHLANLRASNPGVKVHVSMGRTARGPSERERIWRSGDRAIRAWWRRNRREVRSERVAFIEWDVVVNADLRELARAPGDVIGREKPWRDSKWIFWGEVPLMPVELRPYATGLSPLAFLVVRRECLDFLLEPRWDDLFAADFYCELRTPTILAAGGFSIAEHEALRECRWYRCNHPGDKPGIWHAVKRSI